jgi:cytochrome oxidase Cu insertion factor (SCO1/SenC/PrrC family)
VLTADQIVAVMSRLRKILLTTFFLLLVVAGLVAWKMTLPKPQSSFADLQPAPDFTLNDQDGQPFTLSNLRGSRVVLVFYRGYW